MSDTGLTPVMGEADREAARELSMRGASPPVKVPGYDQEQFLGHGAYGEVWTAVNRNSGRRVAIKFFTRRGGLDWAALAREVEKLRYLFSDRHVVQLFEVGWESDPPYYVMEYMENGSLEDLLRSHTISVHEAVAIFREVATALVHAHDKGILHCDLKPANILLDHDRKPRLADFGQSRLTNEMSPALGTLFYMAPEQADLTAAPDARWDVYALGAVMYRMLTGDLPYRDENGAGAVTTGGSLETQLAAYRKLILDSPRPRAHRATPGVDAGLASIIDRCLEPAPGKRFPNPQAVLSAIDTWHLQRVRQPLLWLTGVTFAMLFIMLIVIGQYLFRTTVNTAEDGVVGGAIEGNRFAAEAEARQLASQVQLRWVQLEALARNARVRELLMHGHGLKEQPELTRQFDQLLGERKERGDRQFSENEKSSLWFALDAGGYQRAGFPTYEPGRHIYRGYRDYFHGRGEHPSRQPPPPGIIQRPHRSAAYLRDRQTGERIWSVAFTVPVMSDEPAAKPIGVVGMTISLADAPGDAAERFAVLVDTRPDSKNGRRGLILRHPYWAELDDVNDPPLFYADEVVKWADAAAAANNEMLPFEAGTHYIDPVSQPSGASPGIDEFAGAWLASVHRVRVGPDKIDTGWVVLVQERRSVALQPVRDLQWRLGYVGFVAIVLVIVLVVLMWAGVASVMDTNSRSLVTKLLRRWAGLPTGGTGGTAGANPRTSLPAERTTHDRDGNTPGPGG